MELSEYVRLLRRNWIVITAVTLIGLLAGVGVSLLMTKEYTSTTKLFVSVQSQDSNSTVDAFQGGNAAQQRVRSYVDVVTSARVLAPVVDKLGLDMSSKALAGKVSASSPTNSVLVDVAVTDEDPALAARIANTIGTSFRTVVADELEVPASGGESLVKIETIEPAVPSMRPTSPNISMNAVVGAFAGLLAGVAIAAIRSTLDTRIRGVQDVVATLDLPVLGGIGFDPRAAVRPLVVQADPRSALAEAFRALRTNLRFVGLESAHRTFVTTSAMPAEGKSTTTANLAIAIAEGGHSVIVVDGDLRRPRAAELLGVEGAVGLTDVLVGAVELDDAVQPWGRGRMAVLAAGSIPPNPSELLGSAAMKAVIDELSRRYEYVLIDAPPVLPVTDAAVLTAMTSGAILVTASNRSIRPQLRAAHDSLQQVGATVLGTVVTMLPARGSNSYGYSHYTSYYGTETGQSLGDHPTRTARRRRAEVTAPGAVGQ